MTRPPGARRPRKRPRSKTGRPGPMTRTPTRPTRPTRPMRRTRR
jgi:hypothetical protein